MTKEDKAPARRSGRKKLDKPKPVVATVAPSKKKAAPPAKKPIKAKAPKKTKEPVAAAAPTKKASKGGKKGKAAAAPKIKAAEPKGKKGGKKAEVKKPMTSEELDKEMDDYMMKDGKTAGKKLDEDMDGYWEAKKAKEAAAAQGEQPKVAEAAA